MIMKKQFCKELSCYDDYCYNNYYLVIATLCIQLYHFRQRQLPADNDEEAIVAFAKKLPCYAASIPDYTSYVWMDAGEYIRKAPMKYM